MAGLKNLFIAAIILIGSGFLIGAAEQESSSVFDQGTAAFEQGYYGIARAKFTQVIETDPENIDAYLQRARAALRCDDPEPAIADIDAALRLQPDSALAYGLRGWAYMQREEFEAAIEDLSEAIRLDRTDKLSWTMRGEAYAKCGQSDKALADYSEVLRLDPDHVATLVNRGKLFQRPLKEYDKALADFDGAIELQPNLAVAYAGRSKAYRGKEDYDRALRECTRSLQLDPGCIEALVIRAELHLHHGQVMEAQRTLNTIIALDDTLRPAYLFRAMLLMAQGKRQAALDDVAMAITLPATGKNAVIYISGVKLNFTDEKNPEQRFKTTLPMDGTESDPYCLRAFIEMTGSEYERALEDLDIVCRLNPEREDIREFQDSMRSIVKSREDSGNTKLLLSRAETRLRDGRLDEALADYNRIIELDPSHALAYALRGATYREMKQYDRALDDCAEAIRLDPSCLQAYAMQAGSYEAQQRLDKAIEVASRAIEQDDTLRVGYVYRAALFHRLGKRQPALDDLDAAIALPATQRSDFVYRKELHVQIGHPTILEERVKTDLPIDGSESDPYCLRLLIEVTSGELERGLEDANTICRLRPERDDIRKYRDALRLVVESGLKSGAPEWLVWRARVHTGNERYDEALEDLDRAIQVDPEMAEAYKLRAWLHGKQESHDAEKADTAKYYELMATPGSPTMR